MIKENPGDADAWQALGRVLEKQSRLEEAKNALLETIRLDPKNCRTLVCLGQLLTFSDLYEPKIAEEHLLQALEFEPGSFAPTETLAFLFWFTEQRDKAMSYFESSLELKPYATTLELDYIDFLTKIQLTKRKLRRLFVQELNREVLQSTGELWPLFLKNKDELQKH